MEQPAVAEGGVDFFPHSAELMSTGGVCIIEVGF